MFAVQSAIIRWLDWVFGPFKGINPVWALLAISAVTTLLFLEVFRRTTNSTKLQEAKNGMQARLLEVRLFKDSPSIVLAALAGMLFCNFRYLKHSLKPTLLLLPLLLVLMVHLDAWFGHSPLQPGLAALVRVKLHSSVQQVLEGVSAKAPPGLSIETPALRIPAENEISWVVRPKQTGLYTLLVRAAGAEVQKTIVVTNGRWDRVATLTVASGFWNHWTHPGEASLPRDSQIEWLEINYPDRTLSLFGWNTHWLVLFFLFTCVLGIGGSKLLRVTV